jgi:hypothetical protein
MAPLTAELYDVFVNDILPLVKEGDPWTATQVSDWMNDTEHGRPLPDTLEDALAALVSDGYITIVEGLIHRA